MDNGQRVSVEHLFWLKICGLLGMGQGQPLVIGGGGLER